MKLDQVPFLVLVQPVDRVTVPHVVESILLPSKQIAEPFRGTIIQTKAGLVVAGLVVQETARELEMLLPDTTRKKIGKDDIEERVFSKISPMPAAIVRTPVELRDLLAYMLSANPLPP